MATEVLYKKGDEVQYQLEYKGGVGKHADGKSKGSIKTGTIRKRKKDGIRIKYEVGNGLWIGQHEIIGLVEMATPGNVNGMGPTTMPGADGALPDGSGDIAHTLGATASSPAKTDLDESHTFLTFDKFINEAKRNFDDKNKELQIISKTVKDSKGKNVKIETERYGQGLVLNKMLITFDDLFEIWGSVYTGRSDELRKPDTHNLVLDGKNLPVVVYHGDGINKGLIINKREIPWESIFGLSNKHYDI